MWILFALVFFVIGVFWLNGVYMIFRRQPKYTFQFVSTQINPIYSRWKYCIFTRCSLHNVCFHLSICNVWNFEYTFIYFYTSSYMNNFVYNFSILFGSFSWIKHRRNNIYKMIYKQHDFLCFTYSYHVRNATVKLKWKKFI